MKEHKHLKNEAKKKTKVERKHANRLCLFLEEYIPREWFKMLEEEDGEEEVLY